MARSSTLRGWFAGVGVACSIAMVTVVPALTASAAIPVTASGPAVVVSGAVAPDPAPADGTGVYPAAPDPSWRAVSTPDRRSTVTIGGRDLGVACLDLCGSSLPGDYSAAAGVTAGSAVSRILAAAPPPELTGPAEATAVQAAVWYVTAGFVLDADADPTIRQRVAELVSGSGEPVLADQNVDGSPRVGTVLVGDDAGAPRLVVSEASRLGSALAAAQPDALVAAADEASTATGSTTSMITSGTTSTTATAPTSSTTGPTSSASTTTSSSDPTDPTTSTTDTATVFHNCAAVRSAVGRPLTSGEPGYAPDLDRDGDGIACERESTSTNPATSSSAAAIDDPSDSLPATGFGVGRAMTAGGALVLLGGSLLIVSRPRRHSPAHRH